MNAIPTPLTDDCTFEAGKFHWSRSVVDADFARDLERRLRVAHDALRKIENIQSLQGFSKVSWKDIGCTVNDALDPR
jgi:hypothetical protein